MVTNLANLKKLNPNLAIEKVYFSIERRKVT